MAIVAAAFFVLPLVYADHQPGHITVGPGDEVRGGVDLHCEFTGQEVFPGDTAFCRMRLGTNTHLDVSMFLFIDEENIEVLDRNDNIVPKGSTPYNTFVSFWSLSAWSRPLFTRSLPEEHDVMYDPRAQDPEHPERGFEICPQRLLASYDGGSNAAGNPDFDRMCSLGVLRGISSDRSATDLGEQAYERQYFIGMTECDCGDQTPYIGWGIKFDMIFRAKVPADDTCPVGRTSQGICPVPLYQRP